jgi:dGTPase
MFAIGDLAEVPLVGDILREIDAAHPRIEPSRRVHELRRRLITRMIEDVIAQTKRNVAARGIDSAEGVRAADGPVVTFSPAMAQADRAIKDFLFPRLYRHARIMRIMSDAERVVRELFARYVETPHELPAEWRQGSDDPSARALRVADFIAGMTDRYAMIEHARLIGNTPELR